MLAGAASQAQAPIERRAPQGVNQELPLQTLHVETRLVTVALNVVDMFAVRDVGDLIRLVEERSADNGHG